MHTIVVSARCSKGHAFTIPVSHTGAPGEYVGRGPVCPDCRELVTSDFTISIKCDSAPDGSGELVARLELDGVAETKGKG